MLTKLIIQNFVLIDSLEIDFSSGFSVITGETGAGKSIILDALGLLMGQRADSSSIRPGADKCIIEAHFSAVDDKCREFMTQEDIDFDPNECFIRREISIKGKSRSFVNDTPTSLNLLKQLSEYLIDIHSQHKNLLLGDAHFQLSVLDLYSQNQQLIEEYQSLYRSYQQKNKELQAAENELATLIKEQDYLQFQYDQLVSASLRPGELPLLEEEEQVLSHALDIKSGLSSAFAALENDEHGCISSLSRTIEGINSIKKYYSEAEDLLARLKTIKIELNDLVTTIECAIEEIEYDPKRLQIVTERIDIINGLLLKHNEKDTDGLLRLLNELQGELDTISNSDEYISRLRKETEDLYTAAINLANKLHAKRQSAALEVEQALIHGLKDLGIPYAQINIQVEKASTLGNRGNSVVTFLFSANKEIKPEPVAHIASGGEISRLMLCIKALISDKRSLPTIIFDEVDTGVSGDIADKIGFILSQMGQNMQVMAVTHLPQIAAFGKAHYHIYKEHEAEITRSHLRILSEVERIEEIARMQSGNNMNEITLAAAKELLNKAQAKL